MYVQMRKSLHLLHLQAWKQKKVLPKIRPVTSKDMLALPFKGGFCYCAISIKILLACPYKLCPSHMPHYLARSLHMYRMNINIMNCIRNCCRNITNIDTVFDLINAHVVEREMSVF